MTPEQVAKAFDSNAKKSGGSWMCKCPCHDDKSASLGITESKQDNDVIFNCLAGCDWKDIKQHAIKIGLLPNFMQNNKSFEPKNNSIGAISYQYYNDTGRLSATKTRYTGKKFSIAKHIEELFPLYNLKELISSSLVYITEGEKDADNLIFNGLTATTNITGASSWSKEYNKYFKDKVVVICQDNDDAGRKRTKILTENLKDIAKALRLFAPEGLPEKGDVTDWLNSGNQAKDIYQNSTLLIVAKKSKPTLYNCKHWIAEPVVKSPPIIEGLFDEGDKVIIVGQSKTRKSFFALQLALAISSNRKFLEFTTFPKKVLIIQFEIKENNYHARCKKMSQQLEVHSEELGNLYILNARGATRNIQELETLIRETVDYCKPEVVILDPLYKLIEGDESKSEEIKPILKFFDSLAETSKAAIIYVHHDKKGVAGEQQLTDRGAGSGVLGRDADCGIYLSPHKDLENHLVVEFIARNHVPVPAITTEWRDYRFLISSALPEKQSRNTEKGSKIKHSQKVDAALEMIKKEMLDGNLEMGAHLFNSKLKEVGIKKDDWTAVKDSLLELSAIEERSQKAVKGGSSRVVGLIYSAPIEQTVFENSGGTDYFDPEDALF